MNLKKNKKNYFFKKKQVFQFNLEIILFCGLFRAYVLQQGVFDTTSFMSEPRKLLSLLLRL